jgi:hypothetical protein
LLAALHSVRLEGRALVVDIGGGSVELALGPLEIETIALVPRDHRQVVRAVRVVERNGLLRLRCGARGNADLEAWGVPHRTELHRGRSRVPPRLARHAVVSGSSQGRRSVWADSDQGTQPMMEDDYVNENARARWIERHATLAPVPVHADRDDEDDDDGDDDEDDDAVRAVSLR